MSCCGARSAASSSPDNPRLFGEENGVTVRVRATINYRRLKPGEIAWVTGSGVQALIDGRILVVI